jgi:hypothetical protein
VGLDWGCFSCFPALKAEKCGFFLEWHKHETYGLQKDLHQGHQDAVFYNAVVMAVTALLGNSMLEQRLGGGGAVKLQRIAG